MTSTQSFQAICEWMTEISSDLFKISQRNIQLKITDQRIPFLNFQLLKCAEQSRISEKPVIEFGFVRRRVLHLFHRDEMIGEKWQVEIRIGFGHFPDNFRRHDEPAFFLQPPSQFR